MELSGRSALPVFCCVIRRLRFEGRISGEKVKSRQNSPVKIVAKGTVSAIPQPDRTAQTGSLEPQSQRLCPWSPLQLPWAAQDQCQSWSCVCYLVHSVCLCAMEKVRKTFLQASKCWIHKSTEGLWGHTGIVHLHCTNHFLHALEFSDQTRALNLLISPVSFRKLCSTSDHACSADVRVWGVLGKSAGRRCPPPHTYCLLPFCSLLMFTDVIDF